MSLTDRTKHHITSLAVILLVAVFALAGCAGSNPTSDFKQAFEQDSIATDGVVGNSFVNESPWTVTSFEATNIQTNNNTTTADIKATIENSSFTTELDIKGTANKGKDSTTYDFSVIGSDTTAKKGIDYDTDNGLENVEATLSEDGKSCSVQITKDFEYWFADVSINDTYYYNLGVRGWSFDKVDNQTSTRYKNLDGVYTSPAGEKTHYSDFTIFALNPETGEFNIKFTQDEIHDETAAQRVWSVANVDLSAGIKPEKGSLTEGAMDDGYIYRFTATGTSDAGQGTASMTGYIGEDSSGNSILYIDQCKVATFLDYRLAWKPTNDIWTREDFVMTKQS